MTPPSFMENVNCISILRDICIVVILFFTLCFRNEFVFCQPFLILSLKTTSKMTYCGVIGSVRVTRREAGIYSLEWEIPRFHSLAAEYGDSYSSPSFNACVGRWFFYIFPKGMTPFTSGCCDLILCRWDSGAGKTLSVTAVIRDVEGVEYMETVTQEFSPHNRGCCWLQICQRWRLSEEGLLNENPLMISLELKIDQLRDVEAPATVDPYRNYMTTPIGLPDSIDKLPSMEFCTLQYENLTKDIGIAEEISHHSEGKPLCPICTLNVATRVVVPCGHWCGCYDCAKRFIDTERFYEFTLADGSTNYSYRRLPKTCPSCRAIIGKLLRVF